MYIIMYIIFMNAMLNHMDVEVISKLLHRLSEKLTFFLLKICSNTKNYLNPMAQESTL